MKMNKLLFPTLLLSVALARGQQVPPPSNPGSPVSELTGSPNAPAPPAPREAEEPPALGPDGTTTIGAPALPGAEDIPDVPPPPAPPAGAEDEGDSVAETGQIEEANGGFLIRDAAINDIFQMLAKRADKQYFHNTRVAGPEFNVSGHLNGGDPLQQMEELAFMYGLTLYQKGNTVYALNSEQLNQLPASEWHYQLRYLRPTDIEQIKALIQPMLSPTGITNFEPKTNTIIIIDSAHQVERAKDLLTTVDQPKGQIVVEVKILRVNSSVAEQTGVDWSSSLGAAGVPIETVGSLNSLFGINSSRDSGSLSTGDVLNFRETSTADIVLSPLQINGVMRALSSGGLVTQTSNPTLITEDNELATISLIDRVPIITTTVNETEVSNNITEEVRYQIDQKDPVGDPTTTREIGVTMAVTPTLLPDGTIRMKMRPRQAQIVAWIVGQSGNEYPRVAESMIEATARIPNGYSLVVGGFYGQTKEKKDNKVPLLGDIPIIGFFFKSKDNANETASLVFVVTPTSYSPHSIAENCDVSRDISNKMKLKTGHDWIDPTNPGPAHLPDLDRSIKALNPSRPPYHPKPEQTPLDLEGCCDDRSKSTLRQGRVQVRRKR